MVTVGELSRYWTTNSDMGPLYLYSPLDSLSLGAGAENQAVQLQLRLMRRVLAAVLLLCAACASQAPLPIPYSEVPQRHELLNNRRVTVSLLELAPNEATPMHKY